jgi:hypothetical protein
MKLHKKFEHKIQRKTPKRRARQRWKYQVRKYMTQKEGRLGKSKVVKFSKDREKYAS